MPTGEALLSGYYLNELLMLLLAREDAHPLLFDVYTKVVQLIASEHGEVLEAALRAFELMLLREIGLLPMLDAQTMTLLALHPDERYCLVPEGGLRQASQADRTNLSGSQWAALQQTLGASMSLPELLRVCAEVATPLKPQLRTLLNYHCGVSNLRTRQMMIDLQSL
jgi:DNA repair protein RecO (recombination protein O)